MAAAGGDLPLCPRFCRALSPLDLFISDAAAAAAVSLALVPSPPGCVVCPHSPTYTPNIFPLFSVHSCFYHQFFVLSLRLLVLSVRDVVNAYSVFLGMFVLRKVFQVCAAMPITATTKFVVVEERMLFAAVRGK